MKLCKKCIHHTACVMANPDMVKKTFECEHFEDKEKIKSALEKQIPKKPTPHKVEVDKIKIGNANWCKGTTVYKCPCCNELISRIYDYCYKCGQALDWSDTE